MQELLVEIRNCKVCEAHLPLEPRPIVAGNKNSKIILVSQAPGRKAHVENKAWEDPSGRKLREWLGVTDDDFYDPDNFGIIPIQCERISGKNSTDIKLCVDLMKDLYSIDNISLFYIITTDSDYRHIISEIKIKNKKIHCIGNNCANISLMSICDKYTKISILQSSENNIKNKDTVKDKQTESTKKNIDDSTLNLYRNEVKDILGDNSQVNLSLVKDILTRKYNFDFREWGYHKMSTFLLENFKDSFKINVNKTGSYITSI